MDANKLVQVYIKIRDAKAEKTKEMEAEIAALDAQLDAIETELLELCKTTGQDGGKTQFGSFRRSVKTRYWTSDWDSMYRFIKEHDALSGQNGVEKVSHITSRVTGTKKGRQNLLPPRWARLLTLEQAGCNLGDKRRMPRARRSPSRQPVVDGRTRHTEHGSHFGHRHVFLDAHVSQLHNSRCLIGVFNPTKEQGVIPSGAVTHRRSTSRSGCQPRSL